MSLPITSYRYLQTLIALCFSVVLCAGVYAAPKAKERGPSVAGERQLPQIRNKRGPRGRKDKEIDFRYRGKNHRMVLTPSSARADTFRVTAIGKNGMRRTVAVEPSTLYKGYLANDPEAKVAVTLDGERIHGFVKMPNGEVIGIQPEIDEHESMHRVYSAEDIQEPEALCAVLDPVASPANSSGSNSNPLPTAQAATAPSTVYIAEIAFEADYQFFVQNGNSVVNTVLDIESILNGINTIYENDVAIRYVLTEIIVRETIGADPYTTSVASNLVNEIRIHWNDNYNSGINAISRDVAHLMTGRDLVGSTIGIAYSGAICSLPSFAYGLSQSRFSTTYARRVALTAHELGHNWSASHCSCNIMCSSLGACGGALTQFSPTSISTIVAYRDANNGCLDLGNQPPTATDDSFAVTPNANTNLNLLANDYDADGNTIVLSSITSPSHGTASINPDDTILYKSDETYLGADSFNYVITDNTHGSATGTVTVGVGTGVEYEYYESMSFFNLPLFDTLTPIETGITSEIDLSEANRSTDFAMRFRTDLNVPSSGTYTFYLIGNDRARMVINGNTLMTTQNGQSIEASASISLSQGLHDFEIQYYDNDFTGFNVFTQLEVRWMSSTISKQIIPTSNYVLLSPNLSPVAIDDTGYTTENTPVSIQVLTNDFDPDGISVSLSSNTTPAGGSASISGSEILYTPSSNYFGTEQITYTISDVQGATNSATLEILVDTDSDSDSIYNLFDPDDDNDGVSDEAEAIAGTSSTNSQSFFMADMASGPAVTFMGVTGRLYQVQCKTNLSDMSWVNLGGETSGQGLLIQVPATNITDAAYYRVGVRLAP